MATAPVRLSSRPAARSAHVVSRRLQRVDRAASDRAAGGRAAPVRVRWLAIASAPRAVLLVALRATRLKRDAATATARRRDEVTRRATRIQKEVTCKRGQIPPFFSLEPWLPRGNPYKRKRPRLSSTAHVSASAPRGPYYSPRSARFAGGAKTIVFRPALGATFNKSRGPCSAFVNVQNTEGPNVFG